MIYRLLTTDYVQFLMSTNSRTNSILQFLLIFALVYLLTQMGMRYFFPDQYGQHANTQGVFLEMVDDTVKGQHHPEILIKNKTETDLTLTDRCPMPPVDVFFEGELITTEETTLPCEPLTVVPAGETVTYSLAAWKYALFDTYGNYRLTLPVPEEVEGTHEVTFTYYEPGFVTQIFRTFISKPLLNGLIFIASYMPSYSLGLAIIILTIIIKLILFVPTQHALEGQRKMQAVQPKMDALKKKYKDQPQKLQAETMKIWKEHNVNPMQSCLPMLIQFPILIGLFYTIRDGSVLALSKHLLYPVYQNLSWTFDTQFLGLNLTEPNLYILPPLLMVMQFVQMKLSFSISKKKEEKAGKKKSKDTMSQQEIQQRVMMYGLPLMIGFFALQFPAAVSLYWGVSTLFAIGQQVYVNREAL